MRGKALLDERIARYMRITPAHAGKSLNRLVKGKTTRDHPRACGEKHPKD